MCTEFVELDTCAWASGKWGWTHGVVLRWQEQEWGRRGLCDIRVSMWMSAWHGKTTADHMDGRFSAHDNNPGHRSLMKRQKERRRMALRVKITSGQPPVLNGVED